MSNRFVIKSTSYYQEFEKIAKFADCKLKRQRTI